MVVSLVVVAFVVPFHGFIGVYSEDHPIYADDVFDSVLHNADDIGSDADNLIRTQSIGAVFQRSVGG